MKNKSYMRRILSALLAFLLISFSFTACYEEDVPPNAQTDAPFLEWRADGLFSELPAPIKEFGRIVSSTEDRLELELYVTQKSDFSDYIQNAVALGYINSVKNSEFFYSANNQSGYKFSAQYRDTQKIISVTLDASGVLITAGVDSESLCGIPFFEVNDILKEKGFTNITSRVITIDKYSDIADYTVESVTAGSAPLTYDTELSRSSEIIVKYYKRNVAVSLSPNEIIGMHHVTADAIFSSAGFTNIVHKEILAEPNSSLSETSNGKVSAVAINGRTDFVPGEEFLPTSVVTITHISLDIVMPTSSEGFKYSDPEEISDQLSDMGFKNIKIKFTHDYSVSELQNYDGTVAKVTADDKTFAAGDSISRFSNIVVYYYQYKITMEHSSKEFKKYMYYSEAVEYFKEMGFVNVEAAPGTSANWFHGYGEIYKISINGVNTEFIEGVQYPYDTKIIVRYYYN